MSFDSIRLRLPPVDEKIKRWVVGVVL